MVDVISTNFTEVLPRVLEAIEKSSFLAIDSEFTGLNGDTKEKCTLFDTAEMRYSKLRNNAVKSKFIICQFGLSAFTKDPLENAFKAESYTFYLCPKSFGSINRNFSIESASLDFLRNNNFDFQKFLRYGLSYVNQEEENTLLQEITSKSYLYNVERDFDEWYLQDLCSQISEWLVQASDNDELPLEYFSTHEENLKKFSLINEIRSRFVDVWVYSPSPDLLLIQKVTEEKRGELAENAKNESDELFRILTGFSVVFKKLIECKKPIVAHNCFTDLILMYHQFWKPLPKSYTKFKSSILELFPIIFDTKHITSETQRLNGKKHRELFKCGSLVEIYQYFTSAMSISSAIVIINHSSISEQLETKPHDAGFDSFASGYIFLRLAHILASESLSENDHHPLTWSELMVAVDSYRNKLNLIRGASHNLNLASKDIITHRPSSLHVQVKSGSINVLELTKLFSGFGRVDVMLLNKKRALVAVPNVGCAKNILRQFKRNEEFVVSVYDPFKHSPILRNAMLLGCLGFATISVICASKLL